MVSFGQGIRVENLAFWIAMLAVVISLSTVFAAQAAKKKGAKPDDKPDDGAST